MGEPGRSVRLHNPHLNLAMSASKTQKKEFINYINETPPGSPPPGTSTPNYQLNIQTYNKQMQTQKLEEANLVTPETSPEHDQEVDTFCRGKSVGVYHGLSAVFDGWTPRGLSPPTTDSDRQSSDDEERAAAIESSSGANSGLEKGTPVSEDVATISVPALNLERSEEEAAVAVMHSLFPTLFGPSKDGVEMSPMSQMFEQTSTSKLELLSNPEAELAAVCVEDEWENFPNSIRSPPLRFPDMECTLQSASCHSDSESSDSLSLVPRMSSVWDVDSFRTYSPPSSHMLGSISGWETASPFELDLHGFSMAAVDQMLQQEADLTEQQAPTSPVKVAEQHSSPAKKCMRPTKKGKQSKMSRQLVEDSASVMDESHQSCGLTPMDTTSPPMLVASTSSNSRLTGGPDVRIHGFLTNELPTDHNSYCAPPKITAPAPVAVAVTAPVRKFQQSTEGAIVVVKEANGKLNTTVAGPCPADFNASSGILTHVGQQRKRKGMFAKPTGTARISKATQAKRSRHIPNPEETALLAKREKHKLSERQRRFKSAQGILQAQNYIVQTRGKDYFVNKACHGRTNKVKKISKQSTLDTCKKLILELQASPSALLCELCERTSIVVSKFSQLSAERRQLEVDLGHISVSSDMFSEEFDVLAAQLLRLRKRLQVFQNRSPGTRGSATN